MDLFYKSEYKYKLLKWQPKTKVSRKTKLNSSENFNFIIINYVYICKVDIEIAIFIWRWFEGKFHILLSMSIIKNEFDLFGKFAKLKRYN